MPSMNKKILEVHFDYEFTDKELAIGAKEYAKLLQ